MNKKDLIENILNIQKTDIKNKIDLKIKDFQKINKKDNIHWFNELCFCILTANAKAQTALNIQNKLKIDDFLKLNFDDLSNIIKNAKHRFHNIKAKYIIEARKFKNIKDLISREDDPRYWLVANIKGIAWKESSHFLRNIGYQNYSILDRHIVDLMYQIKLIDNKPKTLNKKTYLQIEKKFNEFAKEMNMTAAKLDLYMWFIKTRKIIK